MTEVVLGIAPWIFLIIGAIVILLQLALATVVVVALMEVDF